MRDEYNETTIRVMKKRETHTTVILIIIVNIGTTRGYNLFE